MSTPTSQLLTVGHGAASQQDFTELLQAAGVEALVDVRIGPGSRKHPHFGRVEMESWLPASGVDYRWEKALGGFRKLPPDSPDTALRNESFRAYAGFMRTPEFLTALAALIEQAKWQRTAIMCSETVWWRCHRRLIADHLVLLDGVEVLDLMPGARLTVHKLTDGVRVAGNELLYDAETNVPS